MRSRHYKTAQIEPLDPNSEDLFAVHSVLYCLAGLGVAALWSAVGGGLSLMQGSLRSYLEEWYYLQGFFLIALGTWLLLMIRSDVLHRRATAVTKGGTLPSTGVPNKRLRAAIVAAIGSVGTASLVALGFRATGMLLVFMWLSCACICFTAAIVSLHAIDIILVVHGLQRVEIKAFRYSPARTQELRNLVNYFTWFTLLTTIGYAFALMGTLNPLWTGPKDYIAAVRVFWPVLYVPACSMALVYPHFVVHRLIRREKERTLLLYQNQIDSLLAKYDKMDEAEIERTNTLAQMFDRISATPDYVIDFGIAIRTVLPMAFNVATLVAKFVTVPK